MTRDTYSHVMPDMQAAASAKAEVASLNSLTDTCAKAYSQHVNRLTQIARLRVHILQNILYYMQAIWNHEPPDQRFFRLHNTKIPTLKPTQRKFAINFDGLETTR